MSYCHVVAYRLRYWHTVVILCCHSVVVIATVTTLLPPVILPLPYWYHVVLPSHCFHVVVIPLPPYYCYCMMPWRCYHATVDILLVSCGCQSTGVSHATTIVLCWCHYAIAMLLTCHSTASVLMILLSCCLVDTSLPVVLLLFCCWRDVFVICTHSHICVSREHTCIWYIWCTHCIQCLLDHLSVYTI